MRDLEWKSKRYESKSDGSERDDESKGERDGKGENRGREGNGVGRKRVWGGGILGMV